ncbi:MAG: MFS transporter [Deltaproteobacteria bacterium]
MSFDRNEKNTLWLTGVAHFGVHMAMLVYPTAAVAIAASEGIGLDVVLGWSFFGYLVYGLGGLPVGILTDHLSARWVVRTGVLGLGLAMMAVATAEPGRGIVLALVVVGAFASLYHPAGLGLISKTVRARGTALGVNGIFGNLGIAAAPVLTELAAAAWGWRGAYLALGAALLVPGLVVSLLPIHESPATGDRASEEGLASDRRVLFAILLVAMMIGGLAYRAASLAQPAYYAERVGFMGYGAATSVVYLMGTVGQYIAGRMADRGDLRILYLVFQGLSLPFVAAMAFLSGLPLMMAASVYVFFAIGMQPIENSLVARFTPERWRSTGYGLKFSAVFGVGALSVRGVETFMRDYSLAQVFTGIAGLVALIMAAATVIIWLTRGQPVRNMPAAEPR